MRRRRRSSQLPRVERADRKRGAGAAASPPRAACGPSRRAVSDRDGFGRLRLGRKLLTACCAAASVCASSCAAISSRLRPGFLVALGGREREPFVGFGEVPSMPMPRAARTPRLYWLSATPCSAALRNHWAASGIVRLAVDAFGIEHREIVHRLGVALARRRPGRACGPARGPFSRPGPFRACWRSGTAPGARPLLAARSYQCAASARLAGTPRPSA